MLYWDAEIYYCYYYYYYVLIKFEGLGPKLGPVPGAGPGNNNKESSVSDPEWATFLQQNNKFETLGRISGFLKALLDCIGV